MSTSEVANFTDDTDDYDHGCDNKLIKIIMTTVMILFDEN